MPRWVDRLLATALATSCGWYAVRWLDLATFPVAVAQSLVPLAGAAVVAVTLVAAGLRRRRTLLAGLSASLVIALISAPAWWPGRTVAPGADDLVVLSANLRFGEADAQTIVAQARRLDADVLVLLEVTPAAIERLARAGLDALMPQSAGTATAGANGTLIRSRHRLTPLDVPPLPGETAFFQPAARVDAPAGPVVLRAIHPFPPVDPDVEFWRRGLRELGAWAAAQPDGIPLVLAGDFNAGADHPGLRELGAGLVDAHAAVGAGWVRTWPVGRRWIPPFVHIDHILGRGVQVVDAGTLVVPDTDHLAVWARLRTRVG